MRRILFLLSIAVAAPAVAGAQEGRPLTLDEAIRLGRERNRDLKATREHLNQVRTDVARAWAPLLPTVATQVKGTLNNKEVDVSFTPGPLQALAQKLQTESIMDLYAQSPKGPSAQVISDTMALTSFCQTHPGSSECNTSPIVIQQQFQVDFFVNVLAPLLVPYAYHALRSTKESYDAQVKNADVTEAQLLVQVAASFYAAAGDDEIVVTRKHGIEVAQQTLDNAKARLDAGVANRVDVTRAEIALVRAQQQLREANDASVTAYRTLATIIQLREPFKVVAPDAPPAVDQDIDALIHQGLALRPEILALTRTIAAANDNATSAKLRWLPSLSAFGNLRAFTAAGFTGDNYAWALGAQLDWQIYDGGLRQATQHQSESIAIENELRREQLKDTITDEIKNTRYNLETRRLAVETAKREVVLADETLSLTRVQRDAGTATQLDLLQAQDALITAEVSVARARFDLGLVYIQLRRATGEFPGSAR
jgi:outer membrane protein TolC